MIQLALFVMVTITGPAQVSLHGQPQAPSLERAPGGCFDPNRPGGIRPVRPGAAQSKEASLRARPCWPDGTCPCCRDECRHPRTAGRCAAAPTHRCASQATHDETGPTDPRPTPLAGSRGGNRWTGGVVRAQ